MKKNGFQLQDFTVEHVLNLMEIYLNEWCHRDDTLWLQMFKYFYVDLIILFLPNLTSRIGIELPEFPVFLFRFVALLLSVVFMYLIMGCMKKIEASGKTYQKLINLLPQELQRIPVASPEVKFGKFFTKSMTMVLSWLMFGGLFLISVVMIIYDFSG